MANHTHAAFQAWIDCASSRSDVAILGLNFERRSGWLDRRNSKVMRWALAVVRNLSQHFVLAFEIAICRAQSIVIREFLLFPLVLVLPLVYFKRSRVCFLVHHHLQNAEKSHSKRALLNLVINMGFRLAFPESLEAAKSVLGGNDTKFDRCLVYLHPISATPESFIASRRGHRTVRIGIVGKPTPEKGALLAKELLDRFFEDSDSDMERVLVCPSGSLSSEWVNSGWKVLDSTSVDDYYNALGSLHIVVFLYQRDAYAFRPSGVVSDAIAAGCKVLAPRFPIIEAQVLSPARVGFLFETSIYKETSLFLDCLRTAVRDHISIADDSFVQQFSARSGCKGLDQLLAQMLKSSSIPRD